MGTKAQGVVRLGDRSFGFKWMSGRWIRERCVTDSAGAGGKYRARDRGRQLTTHFVFLMVFEYLLEFSLCCTFLLCRLPLGSGQVSCCFLECLGRVDEWEAHRIR